MSIETLPELSDIFPGDSLMAREMRATDWSSTPLGDPVRWPEGLKVALGMLLTTKFEMWLGWGEDLRFFYNDAYIPTLGIKHPRMLGEPFETVWSEVYGDVADQVAIVRAGGATWNNALLLLLERSGYPEETYHSFSYSPLFANYGQVGGLLCVVTEVTAKIISERRLETLREVGNRLNGVQTRADVIRGVRTAFASNQRDFPFVALLLEGGAESEGYTEPLRSLSQFLNVEGGFQYFALPQDEEWPCGDWDRQPERALTIKIPEVAGGGATGTLVLGLNPYRPNDADLPHLAELIAAQIGTALANVAAIESERRRADRIWTVSRDLIVVVDENGVFRSVSPAWTRILGHPVDEVVGRAFADFMHPDDIAPSNDALSVALDAQELDDYENRFVDTAGNYHTIAWHTTLEDGLVYAYGRDITERRSVDQALSDSREQFRLLVQGVTDYAIYMLDLEGQVTSWNEGARRIKGYEPDEIIGEHFSRFYTEEDRALGKPESALETARAEGRFASEGWRVRKGGERFRASVVMDAIRDDEGRPVGFAKITRDITERDAAQNELEQAREALFQSQKMEAIGQLTGGVAHDFNNLLMAVMSSLDLLAKRLPDDPTSQRLLRNAKEGAQRGATLTQRMLAFARRQDLELVTVDVAQLLSGMNDLVQRSIGPEWPISTSFPLKLAAVKADANQLEMALLNLIVNARDSAPSGGPIVISATNETLRSNNQVKLPVGQYVRLVVRDQGNGMDAETLRKATEPFFTTKGVGKGTGLGLPMVQGMAQQIGGAFQMESQIGQGTSAVIWLPIASSPSEIAADQEPQPAETTSPTRQLTVLVVDDDALVLMNTAALLEDLGHKAIEAMSGPEALEKLGSRTDIDLIVTDQAMPGMTGTQMIEAIERTRPGFPVIIASGYGEGVEVSGRKVVRLGKPFDQTRLSQCVAKAIELESDKLSE